MLEIRHEPIAPTRTQRLATGAEIDAHRHDDHQIVYASRGVLSVTASTGTWVAPATRAIWIPAGTVHAHQAHGNLEMHLVGLETGDDPIGLEKPTVLAVGPLLRELILAYTETPSTTVPSVPGCAPCCWISCVSHPISHFICRRPQPRNSRTCAAC